MIEAVIRRPQPDEHDAVRAVVQTVVDEIYGGLWAPPPLPVDEENWGLSWIAVVDAKIVGMVLTHEEWISDLWVVHQLSRMFPRCRRCEDVRTCTWSRHRRRD
jgi:hypothetical protein